MSTLKVVNIQHPSAASATLTLDSSGNLALPAGSASTPALQGPSDTNTGLFFPAADTIAFTEGGTEALRIDSSGRVGIGTSSPGDALHVVGKIAVTGTNPSIKQTVQTANLDLCGGTTVGTDPAIQLFGSSSPSDANHTFYNSNVQIWRNTAGTTQYGRFDSSGRLLLGTSANRNVGSSVGSRLQVEHQASAGVHGLSVVDTTDSAQIAFGTNNSGTVCSSGKLLARINFCGNDGTNGLLNNSAWIEAFADATWGSNDVPGRLVFSVTQDGSSSPTERMRINNLGGITQFSSSTETCLVLGTASGAGTSVALLAGVHSRTNTQSGGTTSFIVFSNGNVQNTNGSYTAISDVKLKENVVDASSQWNDLKAIKIRNWNFKEETGYETHRQIGPIAQELEQVCPGLVFETPERDADGNETGEVTKGVNQSVLYMKAVKALQEAMERIEQLEAEMAEVKAQLS